MTRYRLANSAAILAIITCGAFSRGLLDYLGFTAAVITMLLPIGRKPHYFVTPGGWWCSVEHANRATIDMLRQLGYIEISRREWKKHQR